MELERTSRGTLLVTPQGRPVYRFSAETAGGVGTIACVGRCTATWRPVLLPRGDLAPVAARTVASQLGLVRRPDGSQQVAYDGSPLYTLAPGASPRLDTPAGRWSVIRVSGG